MAEETNNPMADLVSKVVDGDMAGLQRLMKSRNLKVDDVDPSGMTLLQHAAFKGKLEACQLLLDLGADVNGGRHEHNYSTLHFGALSGNAEVCQLLLQYGCRSDRVNSVGRTPAQMAAFVGHHQCVAVINNFIPREEIERHASGRDDDAEKIPHAVVPALHRLAVQVNLHPMHLALTVVKLPLLWEHLGRCGRVLALLRDDLMRPRSGRGPDEVLALKFHHLHFVATQLERLKKQQPQLNAADVVARLANRLLKPGESSGLLDTLDAFVRESARTFPFKETTVFRQLLVGLSRDDAGPALFLLDQCVNGQRGFRDEDPCPTCGRPKAPLKCGRCRAVRYCDRQCQKLHWGHHKRHCHIAADQS